ncbi:type VI secretion system TssO [uncultured Aquimarina sp.]|uniref:type VI secretion system TssO n=1 Tax=uncultured Aquimarina sp. TaxID=575652 RepID=UPI00262E21E1|nr:type VI secretion system TssO [uncultured Aquimarina sp.]
MKPKNSKERRNSVLKFALLFLFTVALIVTAFFFDFDRVPLKENEVLRERSASVEKDVKFQKDFSKGMFKIEKLIDSLNRPDKKEDLYYINRSLESEIGDLSETIDPNDTTYRYKMYVNIVSSYRQIKEMKDLLSKQEEEFKELEEYKIALEKTREQLERSKSDLDLCRASRSR